MGIYNYTHICLSAIKSNVTSRPSYIASSDAANSFAFLHHSHINISCSEARPPLVDLMKSSCNIVPYSITYPALDCRSGSGHILATYSKGQGGFLINATSQAIRHPSLGVFPHKTTLKPPEKIRVKSCRNRGPDVLVARGQYGASSLYGITHWSRYTTPLTISPSAL